MVYGCLLYTSNITYKDGDVVKTSTRYVASGDLNGDGIIDSNDEWEYSAAIDYTTDNMIPGPPCIPWRLWR